MCNALVRLPDQLELTGGGTIQTLWPQVFFSPKKKTESQDMEQDKDGDGMDDDQKAKKTKEKTDSGKEMTPVETSVKMPKTKNEKNKV